MADKGLVYLVLGLGNIERCELVAHLIRYGMTNEEGKALVVTEAETASRFFRQNESLVGSMNIGISEGPLPPEVDSAEDITIFLIPNDRNDPREFLCELKSWLDTHDLEIGRIITLIDCAVAETHPGALPFFDMCIHFSDVVLLGNRDGVSKKWVQQFRDRFRKNAIPSLIEFVKKGGKVSEPVEILFPEARRLSLFFDPIDEDSGFNVQVEGLSDEEEDESSPGQAPVDPYLERLPDGTFRLKVPIPASQTES